MENKEKFSHDVEEELVKEIKVKYFSDDIPRLKINPKGDLIDLYAAKDITINEMDEALIPLGVAMELPKGFRADLSPRSSTFKNWGVLQTDHCGVIDNSYCGDNDIWMFPALATRDVFIEKNSRICQFRIQQKMQYVSFETVDNLGNPDRKGFGSSGRV